MYQKSYVAQVNQAVVRRLSAGTVLALPVGKTETQSLRPAITTSGRKSSVLPSTAAGMGRSRALDSAAKDPGVLVSLQQGAEKSEIARALHAYGSVAVQGSVAKGTQLPTPTDLDLVLRLDPPVAKRLTTPAEAFREVSGALKKELGARVTIDRASAPPKALRLRFAGHGKCHVDVVIARPRGLGAQTVSIANRETGRWERENTTKAIRQVRREGKDVARTVRRLKSFVQAHPELKQVSGVMLERIAIDVHRRGARGRAAFPAALSRGADMMLGQVRDPTGREDLTKKWSSFQRRNNSQIFRYGAERAERALQLHALGQTRTADRIWNGLLRH